jgi:hypothetical protein
VAEVLAAQLTVAPVNHQAGEEQQQPEAERKALPKRVRQELGVSSL